MTQPAPAPAAAVPDPASGALDDAPALPDGRAQGLAVLLVEDSPVLAERVHELLSGMHEVVDVCTVDREAAAVEALQRVAGAWDVLVLDLHLKQGTGFGVLRALRRRPELQPVVVVLTNHDVPGYRRRTDALGVDHFLDKARDFERLGELLREIHAARGGLAGA